MKRINKLHSIYNIDVSILLISSIGICLLSIHNRYYQFRIDELPEEKTYEGYKLIANSNVSGQVLELDVDYENANNIFHTFTYNTTNEILDSGEHNNIVFSPLKMYLSLGMLAELSDGNSYQELMTLLGAASTSELRAITQGVLDYGHGASIMSNSLWIDESITSDSSSIADLSYYYSVDCYQGELSSESFYNAFTSWIYDSTLHRIDVRGTAYREYFSFEMLLLSTISYNSNWDVSFDNELLYEDNFYSCENQASNITYLCETREMCYYNTDSFEAVRKPLDDGTSIWFILPHEDICICTLIEDESVYELLWSSRTSSNEYEEYIRLSLPVFHISNEMNMRDHLNGLDIISIFDTSASDFDSDYFVNDDFHVDNMVLFSDFEIDRGTGESNISDTIPENADVVDFCLNRPFLFFVVGNYDLPIFAGVVHNP